MGLTFNSTGNNASKTELIINKKNDKDKIIAVAGNPNVGKSTLFNALTGMHQHTGNWPGKTVTNAQGYCKTKSFSYVLVDIPGTYSLLAHSPEEEVARNFICFSKPDAVVVVCDATCLERNLNLVLQTLEISKKVIVCVNLLDEAKRKGIEINLDALSKKLGVPVVGTVARNKKSLNSLLKSLDNIDNTESNVFSVRYPDIIEQAINIIEPVIKKKANNKLNSRWLSLQLLEPDASLLLEIEKYLGADFLSDEEITEATQNAKDFLYKEGVRAGRIKDMITSATVISAENISKGIIKAKSNSYNKTDRKIDKILTSRLLGYPVMILLLALVFWITITGANYISECLSALFSTVENHLRSFLKMLDTPIWLKSLIVDGIYRVPAWVISVMLPPMAIFFPLFTLLEDAGYLPRVAFNLDKPFKRCRSCGKQALTMCMGFGCNAAGVVGCRIIDSPRERMLGIITNSLVPCNGRFPAIISIISMFFITLGAKFSDIISALILTAVILLGVFMTFASTKLLSHTVLKGMPSSYTLEMPPYRRPQLGQVLIRSIFDRTLFVLGRSVTVAIPAGIIIWLMANITVADKTLLAYGAEILDPIAKPLGLDGVILIAFILGFPANEIVVPIILMAYLQNGSLTELSSLSAMKEVLVANGWNTLTAINTVIFFLFHWPCSTTVLTVKKETGSTKWALFSAAFPTAIGVILCLITTLIYRVIN
ncbi:MAG: ferrous iron transport protein B [Acutalibacteraceae bacterium]|nr:ferrous iron transport protein B [Acutalibacteraceae bacterium]